MTPRSAARLGPYRTKRDFARTSEPRGRARRRDGRRYCIHKHAARRLHYDLRLEIEGALESWAVPKGPSLDPSEKRLAVHVEPHPLDYGRFQGVIPEGEYGDGAVMLWDEGTWQPEGNPKEGLAAGKLSFALDGVKLGGRWTLVRMKGRAADEDAWLLLKQPDEETRPRVDAAAFERSAKDDATLDEIARAGGAKAAQLRRAARADKAGLHVPETSTSKRPPPKPPKPPKPGPRKRATARRAALPAFVPPQLARLVDRPPEGKEWRHEIKYDGYRLQVRKDGRSVRILTRNGNDWTDRMPWLADAVKTLPAERLLLDGELAHVDPKGRTDFGLLQAALSTGDATDLRFIAFDLLHRDGEDLRELPVPERQDALATQFAHADPVLVLGAHVAGDGPQVLAAACRAGHEGIVSKRASAPYRSGRSGDWLKTKCTAGQEFVVVGWTPSEKAGMPFASLLLGVYEGKALAYAGRVGTGFTAKARRELAKRLAGLATDRAPLADHVLADVPRNARWVEPKLVAEATFTEWTAQGRLRHPVFQGLREDKPPREVVRETPRHAPRVEEDAMDLPAITHPDRVVYPEGGFTKQDVADWFRDVAERMLPHVAERPLALVRCPDGAGAKCFFQRHAMRGWPAAIHTQSIANEGKKREILFVRDAAGLVGLVQMGCLEVHVEGVRVDRPDLAERIVFDLDPGPEVEFALVMDVARRVRDRLADMDLESHLLATGGKGLHVVVPLARRRPLVEAKTFAQRLARELVREDPEHVVATAAKAKRIGKVFVDYLRNGEGATAVCPYSTRARPGAPIATPLRWSELRPGLRPNGFTLANIRKRLARMRDDPWSDEPRGDA